VLDSAFREDLAWWLKTDRRVAIKLVELVEAVMQDPFNGLGKPEPLKNLDANTWSRRLTQEHRVVYVVFDKRIVFVHMRYHYEL
jgi:toxin YoeB